MTEQNVAAWRCEECRRWKPASVDVHTLVVLDLGPDVQTSDHLERAYIPRVMRVCDVCRDEMTDAAMGFMRR